MRNHLNPLMKRRKACNDVKPLARSYGWFSDLGPWSGSRNRINRGLKHWSWVGESDNAHRFPMRIRSQM